MAAWLVLGMKPIIGLPGNMQRQRIVLTAVAPSQHLAATAQLKLHGFLQRIAARKLFRAAPG